MSGNKTTRLRNRRSPLRRWDRLVVGLTLLGFVPSGCKDRSSTGPPLPATSQPTSGASPTSVSSAPEGTWITVRRQPLKRYTPAVGTLRARQTTRVSSQVGGRVESVFVDVGDMVKKGQVLVRLDQTFFEIEVAQSKSALEAARAALAAAEVDVKDADRELKRQLRLSEQEASAPKERDLAGFAYERAVAGRDAKRALVAETEKRFQYASERLKESQIVAPYDAIVTRRMVDPGEPVAVVPATHLLEIQEVGVLYLEFSLPQELLAVVGVGTSVEYDIEGVRDGKGSAKIDTVFPAIDEATRSFRCRAVLENKDFKLRPGLLARVQVAEKVVDDAIVIPRAALIQNASTWKVRVSNEGHPVARPVRIGIVNEDTVQILDGLQEGDRVFVPAGAGRHGG